MTFLLDFIEIYARGLYHLWPIILLLLGIIVYLGLRVGRMERWTVENALYFAFITATSVGYGDFHPTHRRGKLMAIGIALAGILLTGLIVSIGLAAVSHAFREARGSGLPITL